VRALDERALTCRVTSTAKSGRYCIVTDYVTDPDRATVAKRPSRLRRAARTAAEWLSPKPSASSNDPAGAWSRLIEVQGFGQRYVDASGATLDTGNISGNAISRYITFSVTKASLGTPGPGWAFTVVLTGQDGFSPDQARGFQPTRAGLPVRRLRGLEQRPQVQRRPGHRAEGDGRAHARRHEPGRRARLHAAQPGRDPAGNDPLTTG
jgi:hypothetical protein